MAITYNKIKEEFFLQMAAPIFLKTSFFTLLAFSMLFCFFPNQPVESRGDDNHAYFNCDTENACGSTAHDWHYDTDGNPYNGNPPYRCKSWQVCGSESDTFMSCTCDPKCLKIPDNYKYFNEPVNRADQRENTNQAGRQNSNSINLPVVLAWDNIPGWTKLAVSKIAPWENLGPGRFWRRGDFDEFEDTSFDKKGPKSYRLQIQDESDTGIANLNLTANQIRNKTEAADGRKAFYSVMNVNAFNSRDDGGECFFQNNRTYRWRVMPCCDERGNECAPPGPWQTFKTSPAPEPLGIIDKFITGIPAQDPDWHGKRHLENIDVCSAKLLWCKVRLVEDNNNRFSKIYNNAQTEYAANYQMRVKFSENWSLEIVPESSNESSWRLEGIINKISAAATGLYQYLNQAVKQAMTNLDMENKESCHYLEKQKDGTCKPETISFSLNEAMQKDFRPFFSAAERKNQNRSLFTGDMKGKLTYSWQTKVCFDISNGKKGDKDFPFCSGYNDQDYGQKWKFSGSNAKVAAPLLQGPSNNPERDDTKLIGTGETIQWTVPCGANSFLYDIKEKDGGKSIFQTDARYSKDNGRRTTVSQIFITLTDKTPVQGDDPQNASLQLNKFYSWRVKSCWPSLPIPTKEIPSICENEWSETFYLYTTGRAPKAESLAVTDAAPNADLKWESVSGAKSYRVKFVAGDNPPKGELLTAANQFSFAYPGPKKFYAWQVKTCADASGNICGDWSGSKAFNSGDFQKPLNLNPRGAVTQLPNALSWNGSARYYQVTATFSGTADSSCDPEWFNREYKNKIVAGTSLAIRAKETGGSQYCAGDYWFKVQPCFDAECKSLSLNYGEERFAINDSGPKNTGLMVCGQKTNNPDTDYNEREPCQIKHLILTVKVIIDFITFKMAFFLLPILLLATGGIFYFSQRDPKLIETMKKTWKNIGVGYAFLIFAWMIVSILMLIAGYDKIWWQIL